MKKHHEDLSRFDRIDEKLADTISIEEDVIEESRDTTENNQDRRKTNTLDWSAPQDRSEDLANLMDPLIQQPERETQTPPELAQETEDGFASRNDLSETSEDLAHLFDRERKGKNVRAR